MKKTTFFLFIFVFLMGHSTPSFAASREKINQLQPGMLTGDVNQWLGPPESTPLDRGTHNLIGAQRGIKQCVPGITLRLDVVQ